MDNNLQFPPEMDSFELEMEQVTEISGDVVSINIFNSSFDVSESPWDDKSVNNGLFAFKVGKYSRTSKHLNANYDFRIGVAQNGGVAKHFRYPVNVAYPYDTERMRIMFVNPRIIFEDEANKGIVTYFRLYEKKIADTETERELWAEIKTASGYQVTDAFLNVSVDGGEFAEIVLEQKEYAPYSAQSGYDSLTVYSMDWGNKTAVLNLDSQATAEGATVGGTGNRVEAENAASFGENGKIESGGFGTLQGGSGNTNSGNDAIQGGSGNTNKGNRVLQVGNGNTNDANDSLQSGVKQYNGGTDSVQFGHTQTNYGQHCHQHGYENHNDIIDGVRFDYVDMHGTRLNATRRLQMLRGQWSKDDKRALAIWANGTESTPKNVFTIAASGTPEVASDGVNLGYLDTDAFKQKIVAALPIYNGEVESV